MTAIASVMSATAINVMRPKTRPRSQFKSLVEGDVLLVRRGVAGKGSKVGQRARLRDRPWSNLDWEGENGDELKNEEEK
ncbi:hypothetical protein Godav_002502 [Gossypium davidsonii]|uniref:Uncharacterized protein n=2 Tax=Gossypium TaxID=3633 RepID=A0A7J8SWR2_GOSDV|nr:hypothetical protein [Gossypium davidsonii]MBA0666116.1 hypothetical protein [Gossypium klotzschianum]